MYIQYKYTAPLLGLYLALSIKTLIGYDVFIRFNYELNRRFHLITM